MDKRILFLLALLLVSCYPVDSDEFYTVVQVLSNPGPTTASYVDPPAAYGLVNFTSNWAAGQPDTYMTATFQMAPWDAGAIALGGPLAAPYTQLFHTYAPSLPTFNQYYGLERYFYMDYFYNTSCLEPGAFNGAIEVSNRYVSNWKSVSGGMIDLSDTSSRTIVFGGPYTPASISFLYDYVHLETPFLSGQGGSHVERSLYPDSSYTCVLPAQLRGVPHADVYENDVLVSQSDLAYPFYDSMMWNEGGLFYSYAQDARVRVELTIPSWYPVYTMTTVVADVDTSLADSYPPSLNDLMFPQRFNASPITIQFGARDDVGLARVSAYINDTGSWRTILALNGSPSINQNTFSAQVNLTATPDLLIELEDTAGNKQTYTMRSIMLPEESLVLQVDTMPTIEPLSPTLMYGTLFTRTGEPVRNAFVRITDGQKIYKTSATDSLGGFSLLFTPPSDAASKQFTLVYGGTGVYKKESFALTTAAQHQLDIAVESVTVHKPLLAGSNTFNVTVRNVGTSSISANVTLSNSSMDVLASAQVSGLAPQAATSVQLSTTLSPSQFTSYGIMPQRFVVVATAPLDEGPNNNQQDLQAPVFASADAFPYVYAQSAQSPAAGANITYNTYIANTGLTDLYNLAYQYTVDDGSTTNTVASGTIPFLKRRDYFPVDFSYVFAQAGAYDIQMHAGPGLPSGDNQYSVYVRPSAPEIQASLYAENDQFVVGQQNQLTMTILNNGPVISGNVSFNITFYDPQSGEYNLIKTGSVDKLASGSTVSFYVNHTAQEKGYESFRIEWYSPGDGYNEYQMIYTGFVALNPGPDGTLAYAFLSGTGFPGDAQIMDISLQNMGTTQESGPIVLRANGAIVNQLTLKDPLDPGRSDYPRLTWTPSQEGTYNLSTEFVVSGDVDPSDNVHDNTLVVRTPHQVSIATNIDPALALDSFYFYEYGGGDAAMFTGSGTVLRGNVSNGTGILSLTALFNAEKQHMWQSGFMIEFQGAQLRSQENLALTYTPHIHANKEYYFVTSTGTSIQNSGADFYAVVVTSDWLADNNLTPANADLWRLYACDSFSQGVCTAWKEQRTTYSSTSYKGDSLWSFYTYSNSTMFALAETGKPDGNTTNLSTVQNDTIDNFTIEKQQNGMIEFTTSVDVSQLRYDPDLLTIYIHIEPGLISIDPALSELVNEPAQLTFRNINVQTPVILHDGTPCPPTICSNVHYDTVNHILTMTVSGFSTYQVTTATPPTPPATPPTPHSHNGNGHGLDPWLANWAAGTTYTPPSSKHATTQSNPASGSTPSGGGSVLCTPSWSCGWSSCQNGQEQSSCVDTNHCSTTQGRPQSQSRTCQSAPVPEQSAPVPQSTPAVSPLPLDEPVAQKQDSVAHASLLSSPIMIGVFAMLITVIVGAVGFIELKRRRSTGVRSLRVSEVHAEILSIRTSRADGQGDDEIKAAFRKNKMDDEMIEYVFAAEKASAFVESSRLRGETDDAIRSTLRSEGWPDESIEFLLRII